MANLELLLWLTDITNIGLVLFLAGFATVVVFVVMWFIFANSGKSRFLRALVRWCCYSIAVTILGLLILLR